MIKYYQSVSVDYFSNGSHNFTTAGEEETGLSFNIVNIRFPMEETITTSTGASKSGYMKNGRISIYVKVDESVATNINYILVAGLYGHTTLGLDMPSASLSPGGSLSISFSGSMDTNSIGGKKAKISQGGAIQYLPYN